jgi:hypothetical protein
VANIRDPRLARTRVLLAMYRLVGQDTTTFVDLQAVQALAEVRDDSVFEAAVNALQKAGQIKVTMHAGGEGTVMITEEGARRAVEIRHRMAASPQLSVAGRKSGPSPVHPVQGLPAAAVPSTVIHVAGDMIGSAIQAGSPGASQKIKIAGISITDAATRGLRAFLNDYDRHAENLRGELGARRAEAIVPDVNSIRAQLESLDPKLQIVRPCVEAISTALEQAEGGVVTLGLLATLAKIDI